MMAARLAETCRCLYLQRIYFVFDVSFFSGEGPRSRRYGRTAALRLIVQPCDEDDYFLSFS
jgi:hypothetical protein